MSSSTKSSFAVLKTELTNSLEGEEAVDRKQARGDHLFFVSGLLGYEFPHFQRDCFKFQRDNLETLILAPRGHGKSTICTIAYSLWKLVRDADTRILIVSNTADQADALAGEIRQQTETNQALRMLFGDMRGGIWRRNQFTFSRRTRIRKEASVTSIGVAGAIISRHYDVIILDDVVDEENSQSPRARSKLRTWFAKVLLPCLEPGGELHALGTRYHPQDLYGDFIRDSESPSQTPGDDKFILAINDGALESAGDNAEPWFPDGNQEEEEA